MTEIITPRSQTPAAEGADVVNAVARARSAAREWSALPFDARARHLLAVRDQIARRSDEIVALIVEETGKLPTEALLTEIVVTCELIGHYARHGRRALAPSRRSPGMLRHKQVEVRYEPLGVIGVISPWNYPFTLAMAPVVTALFAGNTVVLKPSEITPGVGALVGDLFTSQTAHADIVQVVHGAGPTGEELVRSGVDKIAFTGSVETGKRVLRAAADSLTPVLLELGGKDPMIVCADADLDRAANAAVWGAFSNAGQTCMGVERVYVVSEVYERFVEKVLERTGKVRAGRGPDHDIGAMTTDAQARIVEGHLEDALSRGARLVAGGTRRRDGSLIFEPTVVLDVDHSMALMQNETFGPVLPIMRVADDAEAVRMANDSRYGLSASVWTRDRERADRLVDAVRSGSVCINDCLVSYAVPSLPFGGVKQSGIGRAHGLEGLRELSAVKAVARDRLGTTTEAQWLPRPRWLHRIARGFVRTRYIRRR